MNADIEHIAIADHASTLLLVAPCTANVIGKFANGIADDFLTSLYLATRAPVLLAPAMNTQHAGARGGAAEPADAARRAACGSSSPARAIWPAAGSARAGWPSRTRSSRRPCACSSAGRAAGRRPRCRFGAARPQVLVTAGPTYEDIDPVRYVGNRSSGRMGFALAAEAQPPRRAR